ncbi:pre-mRNA-splicing factor CWC25 homolog [Condylostylus longicornis]|uniref:pre-mRNA-splicing factor CWC25 homolog n=1 Tax=Condylostylus longicornis TaxID=2530218 RepID=UPI00244DDB35|nr:pre-mRNA-splicing factor CWC25 homolog [Condylostylus longicornis]
MTSKKDDTQKLEWMYKGNSDLLNREEYLLGRPIDRNFEQLDSEEKAEQKEKVFGIQVPKNHVEYECIPFSIREYKNLQNNEQVDIQRKLMEDPLMAIKQKEMETRRKILENPVKLKEIHKILKTERQVLLSRTKNRKSKKKKKSKKKQKYLSSSSSSSSESDLNSDNEKDLDKLLEKKYKKIKNSLDQAIKKDTQLDDLIKKLNKKEKTKSKRNIDDVISVDKSLTHLKKDRVRRYSNTSVSSSDKNFKCKERDYKRNNLHNDPLNTKKIRNNPSGSPNTKQFYRKIKNFSRSRSNSSERMLFKLGRNADKKFIGKNYGTKRIETHRSKNTTYVDRSPKYKINDKKEFKRSAEEKQKRLEEMMADAAKRDEERASKVRKYRKDCEEEELAQKNRQYDEQFAKNQFKKALSSNNSVESRIKSKINNIQRSSFSMNSNFAKK